MAPPTAAAQKPEEPPLTYLNKGQFYNIGFTDAESWDGMLTSTIIIMFHDESHRQAAPNYWKFWLSQQKSSQNARAIELDMNRCSGVQETGGHYFDRLTFRWNGKKGATIHIRFNCLSTDFSRIKGVKGIPLRLHVETQHAEKQLLEKTYCRIKLFRDKGAERKNKDDTKHLERQYEKLRNKQPQSQSLWQSLYRSQPQTVFTEIPPSPGEMNRVHRCSIASTGSTSSITSNTSNISNTSNNSNYHPPPTIVPSSVDLTAVQSGIKRQYPYWTNNTNVVDIDATYVPRQRQRTAKLCIFARFESNNLYRAVYLEQLTVQDLIEKLSMKLDLACPVTHVIRRVLKKGVAVGVDDAYVQDIPEEQDMLVETDVNDEGDVTLILRY
ncbi:grainyhead-like [Apophysomyces sp. BC1015]|nr:grainyhead-like [Apophysomyces sp. BC1015]